MKFPSNGPGSTTVGSEGRGPCWVTRYFERPRIPVVLITLCLVVAPGCSREETPTDEEPAELRVPQQVIDSLRLRQTSLRGLEWELHADQGISYGPEEPTRLVRPVIRFYDGGAEVKSVLTSKVGQIEERTRTFIAEDSVVVVTPAGEQLETESLRWDPEQKRVTTEAPFRLIRGDDILTGVGIDADPDLQHYTVHGDVRAELREEDEERMLEAIDGDTTRGR